MRDAFLGFIRKYSMNSTVGDFEEIKEYTLQSLARKNVYDFIMFPRLEEFLFKQECTKLVGSIMKKTNLE